MEAEVEDLNYEADDCSDILAKDDRYDARAYVLLQDVIHYLSNHDGKNRHVSAEEILDEFKERALDLFGPLAYTVLLEWGVKCCADIGEMMFNLVDSKRIAKDEDDSYESFAEGYDFREIFLTPFLP